MVVAAGARGQAPREHGANWTLRRRLGLDAAQTRRLVAGFPPCYLSVDDNLAPTIGCRHVST